MRTRSRPPRRPGPAAIARFGVVACAVAVASIAAACDEGARPSGGASTPATSGLVLLAGTATAEALAAWDAAGNAEALPIPDPATAWIAASRRGALIATLADGTLRLSTRLPVPPDDAFTWRPVPSVDADLPEEPLFFATWAPNGLVTASIATDLADRRLLVIVDPIGDAVLTLPLEGGPIPLPPAWLDVDRVVVPSGDVVTIVDTQTGDQVDGPGGVGQLSVSADGSRAAIARADGSGVDVRLTTDWLVGSGEPELTAQSGDARVSALALDRRADRLAVVWSRGTLPGLVTIYRRDGTSWQEAARFDLPGDAERGIAAWLP
jgi:hypothetical protein